MGPNQALALFKEAVENIPVSYKYAIAPMATVKLKDALLTLGCMDPCDAVTESITATQYMIDYLDPYLTVGGAGPGNPGPDPGDPDPS